MPQLRVKKVWAAHNSNSSFENMTLKVKSLGSGRGLNQPWDVTSASLERLLAALTLFLWLASYMSCFWCSYSFVSLLVMRVFLTSPPCKTLWWVSSNDLTKFVLKLSLAHTHLLSFFPCHSTLQSIVTYGASVSDTNSWQLDTVLLKINKTKKKKMSNISEACEMLPSWLVQDV